MSFFVVVRGPLGVGKTTVARRLATELGGAYISVDRVLEENRFEEWDNGRISLKSFLEANLVLASEGAKSLASEIPVVIDGNFYWMEAIEDLVLRLGAPHFIFSLSAPLEVCAGRDASRPETPAGREPRAGERLGAESVAQVYKLVSDVAYGVSIDAAGSVDSVLRTMLDSIRDPGSGD